MTDEKRIDTMLDLLGRYWRRHPSLRLCQLIGNELGKGDHYHATDEMLIKRIMASNFYDAEQEHKSGGCEPDCYFCDQERDKADNMKERNAT